jgi:serine O-acetyltransferase
MVKGNIMKLNDGKVYDSGHEFACKIIGLNNSLSSKVPSLKETQRWAREMVNLLFPIKENRMLTDAELELRLISLKERFSELLEPLDSSLKYSKKDTVTRFFEGIPEVYDKLLDDARFFLSCDPAAESFEEVILTYPGFLALIIYRLAHILYKLEVPVLPRVMTEYAHTKTGIDIHPGAVIGKNCFIDHGTGIVIGETAAVGNNVKIYQGVTLGALYVEKELADTKRHPTIEDNVILYSGCTILGGKTTVGRDTIIGGNVWLTKSVGPGRIVYHDNKIKVMEKEIKTSPVNFIT